jgi:hypothetical protein
VAIHRSSIGAMEERREGPLPKCTFRVVSQRRYVNILCDKFQQHPLEDRDNKGRNRFASLLAQREYYYETVDVLCPICPDFTIL